MFPDVSSLFLWGVPLVGLVAGTVAFIRWLWPQGDEKILKIIGGLLTAAGAFFIFNLETFIGMCPAIGVWGPTIVWSITAFLMYTGHYPGQKLARQIVSRMLVY